MSRKKRVSFFFQRFSYHNVRLGKIKKAVIIAFLTDSKKVRDLVQFVQRELLPEIYNSGNKKIDDENKTLIPRSDCNFKLGAKKIFFKP